MSNRTNPAPYSLEVTTEPSLDPVTLKEVKHFLRVDDNKDDGLLRKAVKEATDKLEDDTRRRFINATLAERYDSWPVGHPTFETFSHAHGYGWSAVLHRAPVVSISSIQYVDLDGNTQTWASSNYNLDTASEPARIEIAYGQSVPAARFQQNAITITYVSGYGATQATVPLRAKRGIMIYAKALYDGRCMTPEEQFAWNSIVSGLQWSL